MYLFFYLFIVYYCIFYILTWYKLFFFMKVAINKISEAYLLMEK